MAKKITPKRKAINSLKNAVTDNRAIELGLTPLEYKTCRFYALDVKKGKVDAYMNAGGKAANLSSARSCTYSIFRKKRVKAYIEIIIEEENQTLPEIATELELAKYWTKVFRSIENDDTTRLKAGDKLEKYHNVYGRRKDEDTSGELQTERKDVSHMTKDELEQQAKDLISQLGIEDTQQGEELGAILHQITANNDVNV